MLDQISISILSGVIIAVITSLITAKLAVNKFYTEKWWERKAQAYSDIINALYDIVQFYQVIKEDYGQNDFDWPTELHHKYSDAVRKIRRATDLATLYVSDDAVKLLEKLREREVLNNEANPTWEVYENEYKVHYEILNKLITVAKKDLKK